jgi:hypothetical protein
MVCCRNRSAVAHCEGNCLPAPLAAIARHSDTGVADRFSRVGVQWTRLPWDDLPMAMDSAAPERSQSTSSSTERDHAADKHDHSSQGNDSAGREVQTAVDATKGEDARGNSCKTDGQRTRRRGRSAGSVLSSSPRTGTLCDARPSAAGRKAGVLAPAIASSCRSGPKDPPPPRRHQATASPLRRRDVDAMMATPAGPAGGRKAIVGHLGGHRDTP